MAAFFRSVTRRDCNPGPHRAHRGRKCASEGNQDNYSTTAGRSQEAIYASCDESTVPMRTFLDGPVAAQWHGRGVGSSSFIRCLRAFSYLPKKDSNLH